MLQMKKQNEWMKPLIFNFISLDTVLSRRGEYKNMNLTTDMETFKLTLAKRKIIFGFSTSPIYENVKMLQCSKCLRFGHFTRDCRSKLACRKCGSDHLYKDCTSETECCPNCSRANENGASYGTRHKANDARCFVRMARIEGIKHSMT